MKTIIVIIALIISGCAKEPEVQPVPEVKEKKEIMRKTIVKEPKKLDRQWDLIYVQNDGKVFVANIHFKYEGGIKYSGIASWTNGVTHKVDAELNNNGEFMMVTAFPYTTPGQDAGAARGMLFLGGEEPENGVVNEMFLGHRVGIYKAERVVSKALLVSQMAMFLLLDEPPIHLMKELGFEYNEN